MGPRWSILPILSYPKYLYDISMFSHVSESVVIIQVTRSRSLFVNRHLTVIASFTLLSRFFNSFFFACTRKVGNYRCHYIAKGILISLFSVGQCCDGLQSSKFYMEISLSIDSGDKLTEVRNTGLDKARCRNKRLYKDK